MPKPSSAQIKAKAKLANQVIVHHFGKSAKNIEFKPAGKTNYVFDVQTKEGNFILRIATSADRFMGFMKEQWATQKAMEKGIPVPEILEIGNDVIPFPYMIQKKIEGKEAMDHPERLEILHSLGRYAKLIHSIPTEGFGSVFNWSGNELSKQKTWIAYLENELCVSDRLNFLQSQNILAKKKITHLISLFNRIKKWKLAPCLNHCDLRLKNVIVNDAGKIQAIIDWEECSSNIAPYWDFSIALHDLSIDGKHKFLEGYGLNISEFDQMSYALTAFNLVNYVPALQRILEKKEKSRLELYKLRLNGALDLFSL
jgi:aminoglycoside phosphotransferase (APT) family kinase protein